MRAQWWCTKKITMVYDPILKKMVAQTQPDHPAVVIPPTPPVVKPKLPPVHIDKTPNHSALLEYIKNQHGITIGGAKQITQDKLPWLAFSEASGQPTLFNDHLLHESLNLPGAYRVVSSKAGHIHTAYDPDKVQPKFQFTQMHNAETVSVY